MALWVQRLGSSSRHGLGDCAPWGGGDGSSVKVIRDLLMDWLPELGREICLREFLSLCWTTGSLIQIFHCPDSMYAWAFGKTQVRGPASRFLSRSKPSAKAEWDKSSLVFITYHHIGQAFRFRRQSKESCVPLFWAQGHLMPSSISLFPCCATRHTALNGAIYTWKFRSSSCPWLSSMPNDILRDFEVARLKEAQPHPHLSPAAPTCNITQDPGELLGPAPGSWGQLLGASSGLPSGKSWNQGPSTASPFSSPSAA